MKLAEHEAWLRLKKICSNPVLINGADLVCYRDSEDDRINGYGLCPLINDLYSWGYITEQIKNVMLSKIPPRDVYWGNGAYAWKPNAEGAKDREEFCGRMHDEALAKWKDALEAYQDYKWPNDPRRNKIP